MDFCKFDPPTEPSVHHDYILSLTSDLCNSARPLLENTNRSLSYMFDSPKFLNGTNRETRTAAEKFKEAMQAFSKKVQSRSFDEDGLSQGAPFIWRALDPEEAPFSLTI